ncbi:MAG: alpha/beta hydrolase [Alteromonadaceae bacterium]|nr:alpha/beta hydrolase [Alteromonadaceae bacterium]
MVGIIVVIVTILAIAPRFLFNIKDLSYLDSDQHSVREQSPSDGLTSVLAQIRELHRTVKPLRGKAKLEALRHFMDHLNDDLEVTAELRQQDKPAGEWVLADGADSTRRILYIHGGGWMVGSPRSHRVITERLAQKTGAAVFSLDYRLMPEHRFMDGVEDCREAYRWLLENGPNGPEPASFMVVAGDSAGGSHTLALIAWLRDQGLRQADAAIALAPSSDLTLTAPSNRDNLATDALLGPMAGPMGKVPRWLSWWLTLLAFRVSPTNPVASPLRGNLANLPPTLIHATDQEMLLDNARRYATGARNAGSPVKLHIWPGLVHVWHMFRQQLPEAEEAFEDIRQFLEQVESD